MFAFDERYRQKVVAKTRWSRPDGSEGRQGVCLTSSARWPKNPEAKKTCAEVWQIRIQWSHVFFPFCLLGQRLSYLLQTEDYCVPRRKNGWDLRNILTSFKNSYFGRHLFCRLQHSIQWCCVYISLSFGLLFPPFPPSCFSSF